MVKNLASGADQLYQILFLSCEYLLSQSRFVLALNSAPFCFQFLNYRKGIFNKKQFEHTMKMETDLTPICTKEFREVAKSCRIKYRNKIPSKELKAMLGYRPLD